MSLDDRLNVYFENNERYADLLNGSIFEGKQVVDAGDLQLLDSKSPKMTGTKTRQRDGLRRVAFGTNFAVVPLENQNKVDYKMPLRCMDLDVREYERQTREIRRTIKENAGEKKISSAEFLSDFRKADRLHPCATIVLFFGKEWDGSTSLHEMTDFTDIPEEVQKMVQDYKMNLVHIRQIEDLDKFKSDLRQVFALVQCSEDREKMKDILAKDAAYQNMEEDAAEVIAELVHVPQVLDYKEQSKKGETVNMCKAIYEMIEEGKGEGRAEGVEIALVKSIRNLMKNLNKTAEAVMELLEIPKEEYDKFLEKL